MKQIKPFRIYLLIAVVAGLAMNSCTKKDDPAIAENQYFLTSSLKTTISKQQVLTNFTSLSPEAAAIAFFIKSEVKVEKLTYKTTFRGKNIQASGLVCLPKEPGNYPILSFQNGTNTEYIKAPTLNYDKDFFPIIESVASLGFIVVIPDYIGFGASSNLVHPYLHAESSTQSILDMLRATKEFTGNDSINAKPTENLFLFGYSQGGWATLELQKSIEKNYSDEFKLVKSSCGAGPYSLNYMNTFILNQTQYPYPYFLTYILNTYTYYDFIPNPLSDFIQEPYASQIPALFDGTKSGGTINTALPHVMANLLTTAYRTEFETNAKFDNLDAALTANSIVAWKTTTPTHLYHGENDEVIPYGMSQTMYADFQAKGTDKVKLSPIPGATHTSGIYQTGLETILWFLGLK